MAQTRKPTKKSMARQKKSNPDPRNAGNSKRKAGSKKIRGKAGSHAGEHPAVTMARGLAEIIESHSLAELVVDTPELTLTLRRSSGVTHSAVSPIPSAMVAPQLVPATSAFSTPVHVSDAVASSESKAEEEEHHLVTSPFVGTFYRRPNPDSEPYVAIGSSVEKGQALCIVEAMKLMNEIEADVSGTVADILVDDSSSVEYDQPLFKIIPA